LRPRRPRKVLSADALDGVSGVAQLLGPNDKQLLEKHGHYDLPTIDRAAESDRLTPLLGPAPFRRSAVMIALLQGLGVKDLPATSGVSTEGMSPPVVEGVKPLEIHEGSVLKYYERYCFGCHRGNPAARLDFMSGDTAEDVLDRLKQVSEIREVLDYDRYLGSQKESRLMPPKDSWQRKELDEARAHGEDDLKKMVDAVPGLFGP
jgi:hypothetical protein